MVLLIGNYAADRQQSMQRFAMMMLLGLTSAGVRAELVQPESQLGRTNFGGAFFGKWLGYIDKFILFPRRLRREARKAALVHICDHSNAMYSRGLNDVPVLVTCHDLIAVRCALGEATDCPVSATGKLLQRWVLAGLRKASIVACDSHATLEDAHRLVAATGGRPRIEHVQLALSYPYRKLAPEEASLRLREIPILASNAEFVLHVGSNLKRKNRDAVLRVFARVAPKWSGLLVFAGEAASTELRDAAQRLGVGDRVIDVPNPSNELLEALYNRATALLYPSTFEGFGWPIIEAQACGCPVVCSDREPMREVSGGASLLRSVEDEEGFAADLLRLTDPVERASWSERGLQNAQRYDREQMIARYIELYRELAPSL
ncbi:MAG: glycosyltransferase family 4 protein [Chthoniobacterales bacterium]